MNYYVLFTILLLPLLTSCHKTSQREELIMDQRTITLHRDMIYDNDQELGRFVLSIEMLKKLNLPKDINLLVGGDVEFKEYYAVVDFLKDRNIKFKVIYIPLKSKRLLNYSEESEVYKAIIEPPPPPPPPLKVP